MGTVITFINEKGGVGKTSACFNLAWAMSDMGKKILMIDLDGQRANLTYFCGVEKTWELPTMDDVLMSEKNPKDTIINIKKNIDLIPATSKLANLSQAAKVGRMKHAIDEIKNDYDYIFIDVNPAPTWAHVLALSSSNYAIVVMLADVTSLEGNMGIVESIEEVQETTNPNLKVLGLLVNRNTNVTNLAKAAKEHADKMAKALDTAVFESKIRNTSVLGENVLVHKGVTEYKPKSNGAGDIIALAKEIIKKVER